MEHIRPIDNLKLIVNTDIPSAHAALVVACSCHGGIEIEKDTKIEDWIDMLGILNKTQFKVRFETNSSVQTLHLAFIQKSMPIIVCWNNSRKEGEETTFSIVKSIDQDNIFLITPNLPGIQIINRNEFLEKWTGGGANRSFLMISNKQIN